MHGNHCSFFPQATEHFSLSKNLSSDQNTLLVIEKSGTMHFKYCIILTLRKTLPSGNRVFRMTKEEKGRGKDKAARLRSRKKLKFQRKAFCCAARRSTDNLQKQQWHHLLRVNCQSFPRNKAFTVDTKASWPLGLWSNEENTNLSCCKIRALSATIATEKISKLNLSTSRFSTSSVCVFFHKTPPVLLHGQYCPCVTLYFSVLWCWLLSVLKRWRIDAMRITSLKSNGC